MAGRIFEECGCEYRRTDSGAEIRERMCPRHIEAYFIAEERQRRADFDELAQRPDR
jgi:hypothetical protein